MFLSRPFILLALSLLLFASATIASPFPLSKKEHALLKKNFYLLELLSKYPPNDESGAWSKLNHSRKQKLESALANCQTNACLVTALQLTATEEKQIADLLVQTAKNTPLLLTQLRASKYYINYDQGKDVDLISRSWQSIAGALNRILNIYVNGEKPIYPKIDAGSFIATDEQYFNQIKQLVKKANAQQADLPYQTLLVSCLKILLLNERDEAIRYEPLEAGWNKSAVKYAEKVDWNKYRYSAILVPGLGPEVEGLRLDPNGAKRCDSAVRRYKAGLAPFIVVSGGHVHPNKTPFAEAIEMKKYLMEIWKIPANAILIEPHARHTTTNLRNMNRMVYRFHLPADKKILIVTDASQSTYILGNMGKNALRELGYLPFAEAKKLSATETEYLPNELSLQINPSDPLDPQ